MKSREVVITGCGAVTPYGVGVPKLIDGLDSGTSMVRDMLDQWSEDLAGRYCTLAAPVPNDFNELEIPRALRRTMGRSSSLTYLAVREAIDDANLSQDDLQSGRCGTAFGETMPSPSGLESFFEQYLVKKSVENIPAGGFFRVMGNSISANIANAFSLRGTVLATPGACASGALAIGRGYEEIRHGRQDVMICGGAEELHELTSAVFDILGASSSKYNDRPEATPAPFDAARDGTVCGEASGAVIIEEKEHARRRGAPILAKVLGFAGVGNGAGMAQPDAESMVRCLRLALENAGIELEAVDYINAHATATVQGDIAEAKALAEVFGNNVPVSGLKGYIGHTLGASGAVESIATIDMMLRNRLVPTAKLVRIDESCRGIRHVQRAEASAVRVAVKCSFGFGGTNAVLVLGVSENGPK